jgi:hypothetical protein
MPNRTDDFDRADDALVLGTPSDAGTDWVALSGTWGISGNEGYRVSPADDDTAYLESSLADVDVVVELDTIAANSKVGILARAVDDENFIAFYYDEAGEELFLDVCEAGVYGTIDSFEVIVANGDVLTLRCNGDIIAGYLNGELVVGPIVENFNNTETKHGLWGSTAEAGDRFDNFSITGLELAVYEWHKSVAPLDNFDDIYAGLTRRFPHPIEVAAVEPKTMHFAYQREWLYEPEPEGCSKLRHGHPTTFVVIEREDVDETVLVAERVELAGALTTDRYRR